MDNELVRLHLVQSISVWITNLGALLGLQFWAFAKSILNHFYEKINEFVTIRIIRFVTNINSMAIWSFFPISIFFKIKIKINQFGKLLLMN